MKKNILLFCIISFFGCSSDNEPELNIEPTNARLVREVAVDLGTNKTQTMNYLYTGNLLSETEEIESDGSISKTVYNYENGILKSLNHYVNGKVKGSTTFDYNAEKLIRSKTSVEDNITFQYAYIYDGVKRLIGEQTLISGKLNSQKLYSHNNTALNGQNSFTETVYGSSNNVLFKKTYESDTENNPYFDILPSAYVKISIPFSVENLSKKTNLEGDVTTYEYIYNNNHRPTQMIEKINGVERVKTTFIYQ